MKWIERTLKTATDIEVLINPQPPTRYILFRALVPRAKTQSSTAKQHQGASAGALTNYFLVHIITRRLITTMA